MSSPDRARALRFFDVPEVDLPGLARAHDEVGRDSGLDSWVARTVDDLRSSVGQPSPPPPLTARPPGDPDIVGYLPVLALADVLPTTLEWAKARRIPESVTARTMRDVGRMLHRNPLWTGLPGLGDELASWVTRHLIGSLHEVGRIQFERSSMGPATTLWLREQGAPFGSDDRGVMLHIPQTGPLAPDGVRESLRAGRSLLRRRFPEEDTKVRACVSWLLDPQLAEYLPESSNIVAFQRLFRIGPAKDDDGDVSVRKFVFGDLRTPVDALPQGTGLERALVQHWRAGRHWRVHVGWLDEQRV